jgi:glutamate racemase
VIGIEPAIKPATMISKSRVIGVLATGQTIRSPSVERLCSEHGADVRILLRACPGLAEQVERNEVESPITRSMLVGHLTPLLEAGADTLVLGCTHYPLLERLIREIAGPGVRVLDPSEAVARELRRRLRIHRQHATGEGGNEHFYSSAPSPKLSALMSSLWGRPLNVRACTEMPQRTLPLLHDW